MGSFYARKLENDGYSLVLQEYVKGQKRPKQRVVPLHARRQLGFSDDFTIDQARRRARELNQHKKLKLMEAKKLIATSDRVRYQCLVKSVFLDENLVRIFVERRLNHPKRPQHSKKLLSQWRTLEKLIADLKIEPHLYRKEQQFIFATFADRQFSPNYSRKLISVLNKWGEFVCDNNGMMYQPISRSLGDELDSIRESYFESEDYRGPSASLTPEILRQIETRLSKLPGQFEWMFVSLWLGLRPSEIDRSKDPKRPVKIEFNEAIQRHEVCVYQGKLKNVADEDRWKRIPIIFPEQEAAARYLFETELKRPLTKTLKSYSGIETLGVYSGRKGFTDLMLERGQSLEAISSWLGHRSIEMTWKHYKNKRVSTFTPTELTKATEVIQGRNLPWCNQRELA